MVEMPTVDVEKCNGCGLCVSVCQCNVLVLVNNVVTVVEREDCRQCTRWCTLCETVCPTEAITCPFEVVFGEE